MITETEKEQIIALMKREIVPAVGCTEPVAVALAAAKAKEVLGKTPEKVDMFLSGNVIKNAMGVGIPGTGMFGLPIAISLGVLVGNPADGLEVLNSVKPGDIPAAKQFVDDGKINFQLKDVEDKLYIEAVCAAGSDVARVIIRGSHQNICYIEKNKQVLLDKMPEHKVVTEEPTVALNMRKIYDFAVTTPETELAFIMDAADMNMAAADEAMKNPRSQFVNSDLSRTFFGNGIYSRMTNITAATSYARMSGAMMPVMSNSGSGNQGINVTLPVVLFAKENNRSREDLIRALILSHLTAIYIKQNMGRLSALCGCVIASTGASCGIVYLLDGNFDQICYAIKNMIANITGMICDGAKTACALKVATGVSVAMLSAMTAMQNRVVSEFEGIIDKDVDKTIANLVEVGAHGINYADKLILQIMTNKTC